MGCGNSKTPSPMNDDHIPKTPQPIPPTVQPSTIKPDLKINYDKYRNHTESVVVVWLDPTLDEDTDTNDVESQLEEVADVVLTYNNPVTCQQFIDSIKTEKVLLVVSDTVKKEFVANATYSVPQIDSVYHFNMNANETVTAGKQKVYTSAKTLVTQMKKDKRDCIRGLLGIQIIDVSSSRIEDMKNRQDAYFVYDQLAKHIVLSQTNSLKTEENMADVYKYCDKNHASQKNAQEFLMNFKGQYAKHPPAHWYSWDSFLYDVLNRALREHRYDTVYELSVYIRHLHDQINEEFQKPDLQLKHKKLYRGQKFSKEDFDKIKKNVKGLISMSNFLSTTFDRNVAVEFATRNAESTVQTIALLEINVADKSSCPFLDIMKCSKFPNEKEYLLSFGSVFRIDSVEYLPENTKIWHIKLTLTNDYDKELASLTDHFKYLLIDNDVLVNLAKLAQQLSQWEQATYLWELVIATRDEKQHSAAYNNLGSIEFEKGNLEQALKYYEKSLELEKRFTNENDPSLIPTYNNIGTVYYKQGDLDRALESFQKAIEIHDISSNKNQEITTTIFVNMTSILNQQGKHKEALEIIEKCLNIQINIYPDFHPNLATTYNTIAVTCNYWRLFAVAYGNREKEIEFTQRALQYAKKALEIDERALPPNHPQRILHQKNFDYYTKLAGFIF